MCKNDDAVFVVVENALAGDCSLGEAIQLSRCDSTPLLSRNWLCIHFMRFHMPKYISPQRPIELYSLMRMSLAENSYICSQTYEPLTDLSTSWSSSINNQQSKINNQQSTTNIQHPTSNIQHSNNRRSITNK